MITKTIKYKILTLSIRVKKLKINKKQDKIGKNSTFHKNGSVLSANYTKDKIV